MINVLVETFIKYFGGTSEGIRVFKAPGRVNLIGEHTDYNGGFVFPAALTMCTTVLARPRSDRKINLIATDLKQMVNADLDNLDQYRDLKWGNYQLGVADELQKAGYPLCGCDLMYYDKVPLGSGLSSSAAIEIATALALVSLGFAANGINREIDMVELALISQRAEHNYVGVKCGIMDQFASAMGKKDMAIFLDCRDLKYELVPLKMNDYKLVISNTNKKRSLGEGKYNERRRECEEGLLMLQKALPGITCLREVSVEDFVKYENLITDETIKKRVKHVVYENQRVLESVKALKNNDLTAFGKLMNESHDSLRDLYEVTGNELDTLVNEARKINGVLGSRMTGAGFGGCTVSLVHKDSITEFIDKVGEAYEKKIGYAASFYISEIGDGGREEVI
ncbi:galactokinase GalK [Thermoclostridium stercorarium subsp. stercorarium DSM 8532]|jgi:galactokinase|uniref:Galactokinase n=3 Tax=Thermoclostridium stercorarium TaxID=1510 RepID=L7VSA1_THES1|nr:galactokinase [Thermoclostridium stercorarium]AGC69246.1 galactokinase GalK [Thermoclostridium stercorarium subsp. stercorarium DSM 8532]AGI40215.1 GalK [Thermoclostridium stercorarium subsp. stercorarium DSM 8532]ANW99519.1 galactokinase [Thermoclostridium stercorarium subsp. thermolacticum DSM 2910]ANX02146.1 galactokinase [Thermoclostridium stercorarium subsp. leptospartum DSM 9219]UZQ85216.1 galactokinase [Thermoclostridium stercorarium]